MKNLIIYLIGILAIGIGLLGLTGNVSKVLASPESASISSVVYVLSLWTVMYGGYLTIRRKSLGKKLLIIFFGSEIIKIVLFTVFAIIFYFILNNQGQNITINQDQISFTPKDYSFWYFLTYVACYALFIILLSTKSIAENFVEDNNQQTQWVAKTLSLLTPGWAQALVNSYWQGIFSFFIFYYLVAENILNVEINGTASSPQGLILNYGIKFGLWAFFALNDWAFIRSAIKKQNEQAASLHEDSHPNP